MSAVKNPITVMKRFEIKYILDPEQTAYFKEAIRGHMKEDEFGLTSIASLYYDTPDYRLIVNSIAKPPFKEKITPERSAIPAMVMKVVMVTVVVYIDANISFTFLSIIYI